MLKQRLAVIRKQTWIKLEKRNFEVSPTVLMEIFRLIFDEIERECAS